MPCYPEYVPVPSPEDLLNQQRNEALLTIEQELAAGTATISVNQFTGDARVEGSTVAPEGMSDLCVLAALHDRNSLEYQLAAANAGVQDRNFSKAHAHAHAHGHKH